MMNSISVVIPAMNEEATIGEVISGIKQMLRSELKELQVEIIVVDDHSWDSTAQVATSLGATVVANQYDRGKGNALRYGFERANGDVIVMMDADSSHRPEDMPALLHPLKNGAGMVIGSRILGGSDEYTKLRAFGNIFLTYVFGVLHGRYLSDALNGYKAFRRDIFFAYEYTSSDFEIEIELLANAVRSGCNIVEVPSHERKRAGGVPKSRVVKHGLKFLFRAVKEARKNSYMSRRVITNVS
jgi:glycosyltransferase involved in cell wall biosynthesis